MNFLYIIFVVTLFEFIFFLFLFWWAVIFYKSWRHYVQTNSGKFTVSYQESLMTLLSTEWCSSSRATVATVAICTLKLHGKKLFAGKAFIRSKKNYEQIFKYFIKSSSDIVIPKMLIYYREIVPQVYLKVENKKFCIALFQFLLWFLANLCKRLNMSSIEYFTA